MLRLTKTLRAIKYSAWICALFLAPGVYGVEKVEPAAGESAKAAAAVKKADDSATVIEDKPTGKTVSDNISGAGVYGKMETIIFPNIEFEDADIFSVIRYLNRSSKRYDPAKEGVSIVAGFTKETASKLPKITMHLSKIPMSEVLRYVCQITELKFKIDEGVVIIGTDLDEMQTGSFNVRGDLISDIIGIKNEPGKEKKEVKSITAPGAKTDYSNPFKNDSTGK